MPATKLSAYPGLEHNVGALSAYIFSDVLDLFIISLKNGDIIHFQPDDAAAFEQWLQEHRVRNIQKHSIPREGK